MSPKELKANMKGMKDFEDHEERHEETMKKKQEFVFMSFTFFMSFMFAFFDPRNPGAVTKAPTVDRSLERFS